MIKVYNYCFYAMREKNSLFLDTSNIIKRCFLGEIKGDKIEIWNGDKYLYYDDCPLDINFKIDGNEIVLDYFTIDEINGYDDFIIKALRFLASEVLINEK